MEKVRLAELVALVRGVSYKKEQASKNVKEGYTAILRANNINDGAFNFDELVFVPSDLVTSQQKISKNDIVITMSSGSKAHVGKVAIAKMDMDSAFGAFCAKIIPQRIVPKYLFYILRSSDFRHHIETSCKGTNINNIKQEYILNYELLLPSIPEQERIVARIEELFSQLDSGVETLKKTKEQLTVYRQTVLKEAFDVTKEFVSFGKITESRLGKMLDKEKNTGVLQTYLRNINVRWFSFDLSDLLEMRIEPTETEKYSIEKGDLVICEGGEPGRCAVWEQDEAIFYQKALHRVRFINEANPKFYMYYLWFAAQTGRLNPYFTGMGIKHLTGQSLARVPVPNTNIEQQNLVVQDIESKLSVCDSIEKTVDTALQQAEAMRQSILKKAFGGEI